MAGDRLTKSFNEPSEAEVNSFTSAAMSGNNSAVRKFLKQFPDAIDKKDSIDAMIGGRSSTALIRATISGKYETMALLLKKGANIHETGGGGYTALMWAVINDQHDAAKLLLENGALLNEPNVFGKPFLTWAKTAGNAKTIAFLEQWQQAEEHSRWFAATDCSKGLSHAIPATRPLVLVKKVMRHGQ